MKSYTDISQSKKLAEILPLESADMRYERVCFDRPPEKCWYVKLSPPFKSDDIIPCWSLAALLSVLKDGALDFANNRFRVYSNGVTKYMDNPVDACYEMVLKLHELKLL